MIINFFIGLVVFVSINIILAKIIINKKIELIDKYKINGDLVESQMFAYIGMRSFKNLTISNINFDFDILSS